MQPKQREYGVWEYQLVETEMEEAGFEDMGAYFLKRKNMAAQYIAARPILDLCENMAWRLGAWVDRRWLNQEGLEIAGARTETAETDDRE